MRAVLRPEYMYRPTQFLRRSRWGLERPKGKTFVSTPWGLPLFVDAEELQGRAMLTLGIVDLRVSEMAWRLLAPGDHCVDIGANVGAITSLMAYRVGRTGAVWACEPHPVTRTYLAKSVQTWRKQGTCTVSIIPHALSSTSGIGWLEEPEGFRENAGIARLTDKKARTSGHAVTKVSFDTLFDSSNRFKLVKIDVEGHEDLVFQGMEKTLANCRIDYLIFEELRHLPSPACTMLAGYGYTSFLIERDFNGPRLIPVKQEPEPVQHEATNLVATIHCDALLSIAHRRGWECL